LKRLPVALLLLFISLLSVCVGQASHNGSVSIDTPVDHDIFLSSETITINARVDGDVLAAGGTVIINAPVNGDLLVIAEELTVNSPIGGDVAAVGWDVRIRADIGGRILVAGASVAVGSRAQKLIALGGTVSISVATIIEKYAYVAAVTVEHNGAVMGELRVVTNDFQGTGIAGRTIQERIESQFPTWLSVIFRDITGPYADILVLLNVLLTLGFLALGIALLTLFPRQFLAIHDELLTSPIRNTATGFLLFVGTGLTCVLFGVTLVGLPLAAALGMVLIASAMLSPFFVSLALGKKMTKAINLKAGDVLSFVLGFLVVSLLSSLAFVGWIVNVLTVSIGLGAIFYTARENLGYLSGAPWIKG